jgi:hypothetical protein
MTIKYIEELFKIFENINKNDDKKEIYISQFIVKCYENLTNINQLFSKQKTKLEVNGNNIKIKTKEYGNSNKLENLDELFDYNNYNEYIKKDNIYIKFVIFIEEIIKIISNSDLNILLKLDEKINEKINEIIKETNEKILEKNREINNKNKYYKDDKDKVFTKKQNLQILKTNKDEYLQLILDFIKKIKLLITNYSSDYEKKIDEIIKKISLINIKEVITFFSDNFFIKYFNIYFNNFIKKAKKILKNSINENEYLDILFNHFKKTINDFKIPILKDVLEDLDEKYSFFKKDVYDNDDKFNDLKILLRYEDLFNTNNGEWINDSKKNDLIKKYKKKYDELLLKLQPHSFEVSKEFTELYNYSEKIKLINEKIQKGEQLQKTESEFISKFDDIIELIISNNPNNNELREQVKIVKEAFKLIKKEDKSISDVVDEEIKNDKIIRDIVNEKDKDPETLYFDNYITFFKLPLKILTYGGILFAFIVLFISFLGLLILIYDIIINTIKLFVNSANSTNNISLDYIAKSIIRCNKDNYSNDRFFILTEQKQNLSIFNIGAYTLYLLIIYFLLYLILLIYSSLMKYNFVGSINDIDNKFVFLLMIIILSVYSFIHLLIFKYFFKPYVYIPYKTINDEEIEIDKMIASYIIIKNDTGQIIKFNDFFDLLYDSSKIEEISDYFLKEIKNMNNDGCLEQKIIIYNLYEYLRQYVNFDDKFKNNFKLYCSTDENNKPKYENGSLITFISMLKNDEIKIISNYHEELNFINKLDDNIEFYNKLNTEVSKKIRDINKKIITHNKTILPFFITIVYMILIFLLNFFIVYLIIQQIIQDKYDAYHEYIKKASKFIDNNIYQTIVTNLKKFYNI